MAQPAIAALLLQDQLISGVVGQGLVNRLLIAAPESRLFTAVSLFRAPPQKAVRVLARFKEAVLARLSANPAWSRQVLTPGVRVSSTVETIPRLTDQDHVPSRAYKRTTLPLVAIQIGGHSKSHYVSPTTTRYLGMSSLLNKRICTT